MWSTGMGQDGPDDDFLRRVTAPENEIPVGLPTSVVLARTDDAAVALFGLQVYTTGVAFTLGDPGAPFLAAGRGRALERARLGARPRPGQVPARHRAAGRATRQRPAGAGPGRRPRLPLRQRVGRGGVGRADVVAQPAPAGRSAPPRRPLPRAGDRGDGDRAGRLGDAARGGRSGDPVAVGASAGGPPRRAASARRPCPTAGSPVPPDPAPQAAGGTARSRSSRRVEQAELLGAEPREDLPQVRRVHRATPRSASSRPAAVIAAKDDPPVGAAGEALDVARPRSIRSTSRVTPPVVSVTCSASAPMVSCPCSERASRTSTSNQAWGSAHRASRSAPSRRSRRPCSLDQPPEGA